MLQRYNKFLISAKLFTSLYALPKVNTFFNEKRLKPANRRSKRPFGQDRTAKEQQFRHDTRKNVARSE
jgi:hypothetical protein